MKLESNNPKIANQQFENLSFIKSNHTFKSVITRVSYDNVSYGTFVLYKGAICFGEYTKKHHIIEMDSAHPRLECVQAMVNFGIITQDEFEAHKKDVKAARAEHSHLRNAVHLIVGLEEIGIKPPKKLLKMIGENKNE